MLDLVTALHKGLQEKEKQRHEWDKTAIHVTDLSITLGGDDGGCAHSLWKRVRNYPRAPETLGQMLMFDNAHSLHERAAELMDLGLPKDWEIVEIEKSVAHKLPKGMKGRLDVKLRNKESGVTLIVDIKTVRGNAFKFLDKPKPAHVLQVQTYIWAENADGGLIVYLDREGQNAVLQFSVPRADDRVLDAMARTVRLISAETPPPIMEPKVTYKTYKTVDALLVVKSPWQCDWCPLRGISCAGALGEHARRLDVEFRVNAAGELRVVKVEKKDEQPMSEEDVKKGVAELEAVARLYLERQQTETNTPEVAS